MRTPPPGAPLPDPPRRFAQAEAQRPETRPSALPGVRIADVAALRADGSVVTSQRKVPALPLFDAAFSAMARGTPLQTEHGFVAIEDLRPGNPVMTVHGTTARIKWIGSARFTPYDTPAKNGLTRLMADSFGVNRPHSFLTLGPAARLLQSPPHLRADPGQKRMATPASTFVDGVHVIDVTPPTPLQIFHLSLERHTAVLVAGLEIETYHPGSDPKPMLSHTLRSVFLSLFPHVSDISGFGPQTYQRAPADSDQTAA